MLMMGGQRAGKTSMLAGLVETMTNGAVNDIIAVKDVTENELASRKLKNSVESLKRNLKYSCGKTYLFDNGKSAEFEDLTLQFRVPDTDSKMNIVFSDVSGEYYDMGSYHDVEVREKIREYDVFLIAIDTPCLMVQ